MRAGPPRTWLLLGDKLGDNAQVEAVAAALGWPFETRRLTPKPHFVLGKPRFRASLAHLDMARSDRLEPPWPDLVLTIGRRPSMAALWVKERAPETKLVLIGRPKRGLRRFDLVVALPQFDLPDAANVMKLRLPLMRADPGRVAAAAAAWRERLAAMPRPLTGVLVGGPTKPYRLDAGTADQILAKCAALQASEGGSLYVSTSRRTPPAVTSHLKGRLPPSSRLFAWGEGEDNPYLALLGLADRLVVTGDSISMLVEAAGLGRPLAIAPLPLASWGKSRLLAAAARRLGKQAPTFDGRFGFARDLTALHKSLVHEGRAVYLGQAFPPPRDPMPSEVPEVAARVRSLFAPP